MTDTIEVHLQYVKQFEKAVVGLDVYGFERSFGKSDYDYEINDGVLIVFGVPRKSWERRMKRAAQQDKKPAVVAKKKKPTRVIKRKCLICSHEFDSEPMMRVCDPCKSTANWKDGSGYSVNV